VFGDAFDGRDLRALVRSSEHGTGEHWNAINLDCACAARGIIATAFAACESEVLPKDVEQELIGLDCQLVRSTVYAKFYELFLHQPSGAKAPKFIRSFMQA
jgi:hypothetical protein